MDAGIWLLTQNFEGLSCWYVLGVGIFLRLKESFCVGILNALVFSLDINQEQCIQICLVISYEKLNDYVNIQGLCKKKLKEFPNRRHWSKFHVLKCGWIRTRTGFFLPFLGSRTKA